MLLASSIVRRTLWAVRSLRYARRIQNNGPAILRISGTVEGTMHLGVQYGLYTLSPSFVYVGREGAIRVNGHAFFYGNNIVRVEPGAELIIGDKTRMNLRASLNMKRKVTIGEHCVISQGVHIRDNDGHKLDGVEGIAPISIGDHVWIGWESVILKGVTVGAGSVIAAKSVVTRDVPASCLAGGNPARVLRTNIVWDE